VNLERPHFFGVLAGLFLAVALVLASILVTRAWIHVQESPSISVMGSASKDVVADLVNWSGSFQVEDAALPNAQAKWAGDLAKVEAFLRERMVTNYVLSSVSVNEIKSRPNREDAEVKTVAYSISQRIQFTSTNATLVEAVGRDSVLLVREGVLFTSYSPEYLYTKAGADKIALLAEATKDARMRAEQICQQGGRTLGDMRSARMGVFQITSRYSTETSAEGVNDLSSYEKTIRAVVSASFTLK
jgi:uncharacterized protein